MTKELRAAAKWTASDERNVRLIAAAPLMLQALKRFVECFEGADDADGCQLRDEFEEAERAIAKAEGR